MDINLETDLVINKTTVLAVLEQLDELCERTLNFDMHDPILEVYNNISGTDFDQVSLPGLIFNLICQARETNQFQPAPEAANKGNVVNIGGIDVVVD